MIYWNEWPGGEGNNHVVFLPEYISEYDYFRFNDAQIELFSGLSVVTDSFFFHILFNFISF